MVKQFDLLDSWWSLILPVLVNAFNVIVMRAFFQELPQELFESAAIDGASTATILIKIVLPLSKAVLAVIGLFYAVGVLERLLQRAALHPDHRQVADGPGAAHVRGESDHDRRRSGRSAEVLPPQLPLQMAILVVALFPILILYPFLQRHFAKGVMIGAVKG